LLDWAETASVRTILMITEHVHARRQGWIMRRVFAGSGVDIRVHAIPHNHYTHENWWKHPDGRRDYPKELVKYIYYRVRYWRATTAERKNVHAR
jgi:hypothetical protein